jgi:mannose-6-phosphate isomerase-like protein (cupin superfamily)
MINYMKRFFIGMLLLCFCLADVKGDGKGPAQANPIPEEWSGKVTDAGQITVDTNAWGTLQWICNGKLMPGSGQTVGLSMTLPGKRNPLHVHPNCEEVLYVISGQGIHSYDGQTVNLKAGMTIRIPAGVKHNLANTGTEPLKTLISFSSGDRKTAFLEELPAK